MDYIYTKIINGIISNSKQDPLEICMIQSWKSRIEQLISNCIAFESLNAIVIGSSGVYGFNKDFAFLAQEYPFKREQIPSSVKNLIEIRNSAFYDDSDYPIDLYGNHIRATHGFMFINVCLSQNHNDHFYVRKTIEFINGILQEALENNKKLAILDMRLCKHIHESEINLELDVEFEFQDFSNTDLKYKIDNLFNFHHILRLGHPATYSEYDFQYVKNQFRRLYDFGIDGIMCLYRREC